MTETIPARSVTERGSTIYDQFTDGDGKDIRILRESSEQRVWIYATYMEDPGERRACPHLGVTQAERVRDALDQFIREAKETAQAESLAAAGDLGPEA